MIYNMKCQLLNINFVYTAIEKQYQTLHWIECYCLILLSVFDSDTAPAVAHVKREGCLCSRRSCLFNPVLMDSCTCMIPGITQDFITTTLPCQIKCFMPRSQISSIFFGLLAGNIKFKLQSWVNLACPINPQAPSLN